jgi:hypothetical protein
MVYMRRAQAAADSVHHWPVWRPVRVDSESDLVRVPGVNGGFQVLQVQRPDELRLILILFLYTLSNPNRTACTGL